MDTEKIKEVSKLIKSFDINLNSEHAEAVAKKYLCYKFIIDIIENIIWCPLALTIAFAFYCGGKWILGKI